MSDYNYRISKIDYYLMLGTAIFFDLIQVGLDLIPFIGWMVSSVIALIAFLTFWLWLKIKGVGLFDKGLRMMVLWVITPILEATLSFVPGLTIMIILTYYIVRADDELDRKNILSREQQKKIGEHIKQNYA